MIAVALIVLALVTLYVGVQIVAQIDDLNAAITAETASIVALTSAINAAIVPVDLSGPIAGVTANRTSIDALTTQLGGTPPGP